MIINDLDIADLPPDRAGTDPPLIVDPDTLRASSVCVLKVEPAANVCGTRRLDLPANKFPGFS